MPPEQTKLSQEEALEVAVGEQNRDEVPVTRAGSPTLMNFSAMALIPGEPRLRSPAS